MTDRNHFDEKGNYLNIENLSLAEIYNRAFQKGIDSERVKRVMGFKESSTPLMAYWRKPIDPVQTLDLVVCSNCVMPLLRKDTDGTGNYVPFDFCPFCGARMKKPVSEDAEEAMRAAERESKYLYDNEDSIAGRWHS